MAITRTYGQLHFLDLGWERFESLVLGMVFKWRRWDSINHVGVSGSDGGVDIEAVELLEDDRTCVYHFQCKRYDKLKTADIKRILNDYCDKNLIKADKYMLVTACALSASCLNTFKTYAKSKGLYSVIAWTKPELETMLYTQYYDLLYIFFGVSVVKQRSNRISTVRRNISMKHRMEKDFILPFKDWQEKYSTEIKGEDWRTYRWKNPHTKFINHHILIRSIDDTSYPERNELLPGNHYGYEKASVYDFYHNGLIVYAFPYAQDIIIRQSRTDGGFLFEPVRATVLGFIPYNNIIDYDIGGDEYYNYPHVYCDFSNGTDPFEYIRYAVQTSMGNYYVLKDHEVAEISKIERKEHIDSLLSANYDDEYDDYKGTIVCADCNKEFSVNKNTEIKNGVWSVYPVTINTLEVGDETGVCFDCYQNHCVHINQDDYNLVRKMEKAIRLIADFSSGSTEMDAVDGCLSKLTYYFANEDKVIRKSDIAYNLNKLLKVKGTRDFDEAVLKLVSWFKESKL